jgi:hypothetical protein
MTQIYQNPDIPKFNFIPCGIPFEDKIKQILNPDTISRAITNNEKNTKLYFDDMKIGNIIHIYYAEGEYDDTYNTFHYKVKEHVENKETITVLLERINKNDKLPLNITLEWNLNRKLSYLSSDPLDWKIKETGLNITLWAYLGTRVCKCDGKDGKEEYFGL